MATETLNWDEPEKRFKLPDDVVHTLTVPRNEADVIELGAGAFTAAGHVPLPGALGGDVPVTGLGLIAYALKYAGEHSDRVLMVAGHAPAGAGSTSLSERRAESVRALLAGDKAAWGAACEGCDPESLSAWLRWVDQTHAYGCTPELGKAGASARALDRFRRAYNAEFDGSLGVGEPAAAPDFEALFDLAQRGIAALLDVEPDAAADLHADVAFHSPATLACAGEHAGAAHTVDLIFFDSGQPIPPIEGVDPPGRHVFGHTLAVRRNVLENEGPQRVACLRMTGMFFDTNKNFLLPGAMMGIRNLVGVYERFGQGEVLIVGHTDTSGEPSVNDPLSLERAQAVAAYLTDDVDTWAARYDKGVKASQRWGSREDTAMMGALPDGPEHQAASDPVKSYQASRGLEDDGKIGPLTRKQLITDYMALDGTTLPEGITPVAHGCGENFPVVSSDGTEDRAGSRRVELFVFEDAITPPAPGDNSAAGSSEYPGWCLRSTESLQLDVFDLPVQKRQRLDPHPEEGLAFVPPRQPEPILLASADPGFIPTIRQKHEQRSKDDAPTTSPGGDFIPFHFVNGFRRPNIRHDHGFLDDGHGNIDDSKRIDAEISDYINQEKWNAKAEIAAVLRPDLDDAVEAYLHFLHRRGRPLTLDYAEFIEDDGAGKLVIEAVLEDTRAAAWEIHDDLGGGDRRFRIQSDVIGVGGDNGRFPYPGTENWQKAIGAHSLWVEADVQVKLEGEKRHFDIELTVRAEDMYNFNPGAEDIATGIPDSENGRFELTGLGHEFLSSGSVRRRLTFEAAKAPASNHRSGHSNLKVEKLR